MIWKNHQRNFFFLKRISNLKRGSTKSPWRWFILLKTEKFLEQKKFGNFFQKILCLFFFFMKIDQRNFSENDEIPSFQNLLYSPYWEKSRYDLASGFSREIDPNFAHKKFFFIFPKTDSETSHFDISETCLALALLNLYFTNRGDFSGNQRLLINNSLNSVFLSNFLFSITSKKLSQHSTLTSFCSLLKVSFQRLASFLIT